MEFLFHLPHARVGIVPILDCPQIFYKLVDDLQMIGRRKNRALLIYFQFSYSVKNAANRIILLIPPLFPKLVKCLGMKPCVNILITVCGFILNRPVDFILVFYKYIKNCPICFLNDIPVANYLKGNSFVKIIPQPGFVVSRLAIFLGGGKKARF